MNDTRNVTKNGKEDVDEQVGIATALEENANGGEDNGEDDFANVTIGKAY